MTTGTHTDFAARRAATALTADLTAAEIVEALALLRFTGNEPRLVALDRDVRDYLLAAVTARQGARTR